ncbi:hypothetical protein JD78_03637 [Modestobacter roseus]|uniref:Uncharacterized protein n=2 Tax=Modestobacter roseus TaxID=1181884 RepID=A0A562IW62_9ACTN|nr:hypothetical protein JD78_03637 [Modestobacter roseus]
MCMIQQTLFISFDEPLAGDEAVAALAGIEAAIERSGLTRSLVIRPHLAVPGEEDIPAFIGSVVLQVGLPDLEALGQLFAATDVTASFDELREVHPYTTAWVNHETLS